MGYPLSVIRALSGIFISLGLTAFAGASQATDAGVSPASVESHERALLHVRLEGNRVLIGFEEAVLERDMVIAMRANSPRKGHQLVRWERQRNHLVLHSTAAGQAHETQPDWRASSIVLDRFPIKACGTLEAAVCIDATRLFTVPGAPAGWRLGPPSRSMAPDAVSNFPRNIVIRSASRGVGGEWVKWSLVPLPVTPMPKRDHDNRLGYLDLAYLASERSEQGRVQVPVPPIVRWRLQPGVSSKIVMHVDPNAPRRWVPWMMRGIAAWQPALSAAGWHDAIVAVDANGIEGWSFDDVRNSAMCWGTRQGCGWIIADPRSGELLQFQMYSAELVASQYLARYVVSMAAVDPRVLVDRRADAVLGGLVQVTTAHEMGHALGLRDGYFGIGAYTLEQARSRQWVAEHGFTPSVMNYTRFNYVLQPEDGFLPEMAVPGVGAGDVHAIRRGYEKPSASGKSEQDMLAYWLEEQAENPAYRYSIKFSPYQTPREISEAVGTSSPLEEARLGVRNLERSLALIGSRRLFPDDEEVSEWLEPERLYEAAVIQWGYMVKPVISLVGGYEPREGVNADMARFDLAADQVQPIRADLQREAMAYLCAEVLPKAPAFLHQWPLLHVPGKTPAQVEERLRSMRAEMMSPPLLMLPARMVRLKAEDEVNENFGMRDFLRGIAKCVVPDAASTARN